MKKQFHILPVVLAILLAVCERESSNVTMAPDITGVVEEADQAEWQILVRTDQDGSTWLSVEDAEIATIIRETEVVTSQIALEPGARIDAWLRDSGTRNRDGTGGSIRQARRVLVTPQVDHR